jgi:hypothetical protein
MRVGSIKEETKSLVVDFGGSGNLNIVHYPNRSTPELEDKLHQVQDADDATVGKIFKEGLKPILASWDLEDEYPVWEMPSDYVPSGSLDTYVWDSIKGKLVQVHGDDCVGSPTDVVEKIFKVVPIDDIGLHKVPLQVMLRVMKAINEDNSPEKQAVLTISETSF